MYTWTLLPEVETVTGNGKFRGIAFVAGRPLNEPIAEFHGLEVKGINDRGVSKFQFQFQFYASFSVLVSFQFKFQFLFHRQRILILILY